VAPLRLTHHNWRDSLWHANCDWLLPRGYTVIGNLPLLHSGRSWNYARWDLGVQLAIQRRWDSGVRGEWSDPRVITCTGATLNEILARPAESAKISSARSTPSSSRPTPPPVPK